ncbi:MAG: HEAT repeat domain-containing protein [Nitrospira sp.]|nr:HEAT repeat domain-containing protein [Nitrospira sp.]MCW5785793.1 HEAT repeat domain-containing protein [Nitrospirales bacterium]
MKKPFDYIIFILLVVAGVSVIFFSPFYFPGFTERQTAELFIEPQNKRIREGGHIKANWHGSDLFDDFRLLTNDFLKKETYDFKALAHFLNEIDTTALLNEASQLYSQEDLAQKLLGALLLSKSKEKHQYPDLFPFLDRIVRRTYPGLDKNLFRLNDYFSEGAILAVGNLGGEKSFELLVEVLNESPVPSSRHEAACQALAEMQDRRAIPILHKKMVDPEFHTLLAAYQALLKLGDKQAEEIARKRVSLGLGGEDTLLREML